MQLDETRRASRYPKLQVTLARLLTHARRITVVTGRRAAEHPQPSSPRPPSVIRKPMLTAVVPKQPRETRS